MNVSASQCGSGCESGWTLYLDQSSYSQTRYENFDEDYRGGKGSRFVVEDEEEGLSMVSDASSGPRQYSEDYYEKCLDEYGSFYSAPAASSEPAKNASKNKKKIKEYASNQQLSYLDDTASSPVISSSKNKNCKKEAISQAFSGTHFKGKSSAFQKKFGLLKSGKASTKDAAGGFHGRNWE